MPVALFVDEGVFFSFGFAPFAVPEGFVGGDFDHVEPGFGLGAGVVEDYVDFFEGAEAGFGVEEVDCWDDYEVAAKGVVLAGKGRGRVKG